jgi:cephalosporin hydroxylase
MTPEQFEEHNQNVISTMGEDTEMSELTRQWFSRASTLEYSYHFKWLGLPIIQFPQDVLAVQELVWDVKPDLIVETGVARGGSLILYASLLELLGNDGKVIGIDIDIRDHNRKAIEDHPMSRRIELLEGSSVSDEIVWEVFRQAESAKKVLVILDSNHTHEHALEEMRLFSPLVEKGSYLVVLDTVIEDMPAEFSNDRPWGPGDNPKTAVHEFLKSNSRFEIDRAIQDKIQITVGPDGYLKCVESIAQEKAA